MNKPKEIKDFKDFFIQWHITDKCNLKCKHCYGEYGDVECEELSFNECINLIEQYVEWTKEWELTPWIHFTGGEPFMRKDFFDILAYANQLGVKIRILTNGTSLSKSVVEKLVANNVKSISVGFDRLNETEFDEFRAKKGAYNKIIEGIRLLKEANIRVVLGPTINKENKNELIDIFELADSLEVDEFHIHRLVMQGRGEQLNDLKLSSQECKSIYETLFLEKDKFKNTKLSINGTLWPVIDDFKGMGGCIAGYSGMAVLTNGDVLACRLLPMPVGNVKKQNLKDIYLNSEVMINCRERNLKGHCGNCDYKNACGGCRAVAFDSTGDYLEFDDQCWINERN